MERVPVGIRLFVGTALVYLLFDALARVLGSDRGQWGLVVAAVVVAALVAIERLAFRVPSWRAALAGLGLGRPAARGVLAAAAVSVALLAVLPVWSVATGTRLAFRPGWLALVPGLFAQAGVAEEALFRGFLFRRVREGRTFTRAVLVSSVPFVLVHLALFATLPFPIALASVLLALVIVAPLAYAFELGGRTIWAPALIHFTIQGALKVVEPVGATGPGLPLVWMAACAVLPWAVFLVPRKRSVGFTIRVDDLEGEAIRALLAEHLAAMHVNTPPGYRHALDVDALRAPSITFWSVWEGEALAGCGALRELDPTHGELKSMRTSRTHLRRGVASALVLHMIEVARARGYRRLSLETGTGPDFAAAQALYERHGFRPCGPFGSYTETAYNTFMALDL